MYIFVYNLTYFIDFYLRKERRIMDTHRSLGDSFFIPIAGIYSEAPLFIMSFNDPVRS